MVPGNGVAAGAWIEAAGVDGGESYDVAARIDLIERLAIVGEPWCQQTLRAALREERSPVVREAIKTALRSLSP